MYFLGEDEGKNCQIMQAGTSPSYQLIVITDRMITIKYANKIGREAVSKEGAESSDIITGELILHKDPFAYYNAVIKDAL